MSNTNTLNLNTCQYGYKYDDTEYVTGTKLVSTGLTKRGSENRVVDVMDKCQYHNGDRDKYCDDKKEQLNDAIANLKKFTEKKLAYSINWEKIHIDSGIDEYIMQIGIMLEPHNIQNDEKKEILSKLLTKLNSYRIDIEHGEVTIPSLIIDNIDNINNISDFISKLKEKKESLEKLKNDYTVYRSVIPKTYNLEKEYWGHNNDAYVQITKMKECRDTQNKEYEQKLKDKGTTDVSAYYYSCNPIYIYTQKEIKEKEKVNKPIIDEITKYIDACSQVMIIYDNIIKDKQFVNCCNCNKDETEKKQTEKKQTEKQKHAKTKKGGYINLTKEQAKELIKQIGGNSIKSTYITYNGNNAKILGFNKQTQQIIIQSGSGLENISVNNLLVNGKHVL